MDISRLGMIVVVMGFVAGCGDKEPVRTESEESARKTPSEAVTPEDVRKESAEAVGTAMALADQTREEYLNQTKDELSTVEQRLETLKTKSKALGVQAREKWNDRIAQLSKQQEMLQDSLNDMADSTDDAWQELAKGMTQASRKMAEALQKAEAEFKDQPADEPK